jgi:hypothetical protein
VVILRGGVGVLAGIINILHVTNFAGGKDSQLAARSAWPANSMDIFKAPRFKITAYPCDGSPSDAPVH